jgi:GNAT superfamily N-acetyltransferase
MKRHLRGNSVEIKIVESNKMAYLDLLLLADEQEDMIDKYLDRGTLFALYDSDLKSVCVVTDESDGVFEIQNLATYKLYQRKGYGQYLLNYVCHYYKDVGRVMYVGTGDSPMILSFYENNEFVFSHRIENYFPKHYTKPLFENGIQLKDKVYLKRNL